MSTVPNNQNNIFSAIPATHNKKRKRKNKNKNKNKQLAAKKKILTEHKPVNNSASKLMFTMSSWAEHFTFAATWQLKHQMAYWKAKAKSLEHENGVLHDIIRKNHYVAGGNSTCAYKTLGSDEEEVSDEDVSRFNLKEMPSPIKEGNLGEWQDTEGSNSQSMLVDMQSEIDDDSSDENQNLEVSEEFIKFLMVNSEHKEQLRLERERQKAAEEQADMEKREAHLRARRHYGLSAQDLYGDKWQKLAALEMSMKCDYISDIDRNTPAFWPVIPFNFDLHYSYSNQKL